MVTGNGNRTVVIDCLHVWREISNYLDDTIDADLRARMEAHFKVCTHCSAILNGTRNMVKLVADDRLFELPKGFSERLKQRLAKNLEETN
jgi:hypothetical protein